ncbi:MAG: hypothetical protein WA941_07880 [Nitrososphaeraceae archaeon]
MNADGKSQWNLINNSAAHYTPSWSAGGTGIIFSSSYWAGRWRD